VDTLPAALLKTIRKQGLIRPGDRVGAAVSGGADSVALLLLLLELRQQLGFMLSVTHVNHKLRGQESDEDERFVAALASQHKLEVHAQACPLQTTGIGMEAEARTLRYEVFESLLAEGQVTKIPTGHTLDDQAETVLLRIVRGAGIRGLGGILPRLALGGGEVVRPLLGVRRSEVENFLRERGQPWREDSSNRDVAILRNRVRHRLLPLMYAELGGAVAENLADLAEIARAEEEHWQTEHARVSNVRKAGLPLAGFPLQSLAAQRRIVRQWLEANSAAISFRWIELVRELALGAAGRKVELAGGQQVRRVQRELVIETAPKAPADYEYRLTIPGRVTIAELALRVEASLVARESVSADQQGGLLDPAKLASELVVRNWRPGDRFWPAHTKSSKKIKDLLTSHHIAGPDKAFWPVAVTASGKIAWIPGFEVPAEFQPAVSGQVLWLRTVIQK
jgi:tRNA(Ile)-lysidine synthase